MRIDITLRKEVADRDEAITFLQAVRKKLQAYPAISVGAVVNDNVDISALPDPPD